MRPPARIASLLVLGGVAVGAVALAGTGPSAEPANDVPPMIEPAHTSAPAWANATWLNSDAPITLASLRGRVVLLNFWTYTCQACTNALPSLIDIDRRYHERGLSVIGIHTPEFPPYAGEHDRANVTAALAQYGVTYPVTQDNDAVTFHLYGARYWPTYVLIDKAGRIRFHGSGSLALGGTRQRWWETQIRELLAE